MPLTTLTHRGRTAPLITATPEWAAPLPAAQQRRSGIFPALSGGTRRVPYTWTARRRLSLRYSHAAHSALAHQHARQVYAGLRGVFVPWWPEPYYVATLAGDIATFDRYPPFEAGDYVAVLADPAAEEVTTAEVTDNNGPEITLDPAPAVGSMVLSLVHAIILVPPTTEYIGWLQSTVTLEETSAPPPLIEVAATPVLATGVTLYTTPGTYLRRLPATYTSLNVQLIGAGGCGATGFVPSVVNGQPGGASTFSLHGSSALMTAGGGGAGVYLGDYGGGQNGAGGTTSGDGSGSAGAAGVPAQGATPGSAAGGAASTTDMTGGAAQQSISSSAPGGILGQGPDGLAPGGAHPGAFVGGGFPWGRGGGGGGSREHTYTPSTLPGLSIVAIVVGAGGATTRAGGDGRARTNLTL